MTGNAGAIDQARAYADAGVEIARLRIGDLLAARPGRTTLQGGWLGASQVLPMVGGVATARVTDGGNCFNLNSVVAGERERDLKYRPVAVTIGSAPCRHTVCQYVSISVVAVLLNK